MNSGILSARTPLEVGGLLWPVSSQPDCGGRVEDSKGPSSSFQDRLSIGEAPLAASSGNHLKDIVLAGHEAIQLNMDVAAQKGITVDLNDLKPINRMNVYFQIALVQMKVSGDVENSRTGRNEPSSVVHQIEGNLFGL